MEEEKSRYSCEEHINKAFDDFLLENETFPNMYSVEEGICNYCKEQAKYKLVKESN